MKLQWYSPSGQNFTEWNSLCNLQQFCLRKPSELPDIIAQGLKDKSHSVLMMASGIASGEGTAYFVANIIRLDSKAHAYDQQPFAIPFVGGEFAGSALMIHHGNWPGRTDGYPLEPSAISGNLSDLYLDSHKYAFEISVAQVRRVLEDQRRSARDTSRQQPLKSSF